MTLGVHIANDICDCSGLCINDICEYHHDDLESRRKVIKAKLADAAKPKSERKVRWIICGRFIPKL